MRILLPILAFLICGSVHAQGLILRIPERGSIVIYEFKSETLKAGKLVTSINGSVTLKSLTPPVHANKKERWVEIENSNEALESRGIKSVISKLSFDQKTTNPTWNDVKSIWRISVSSDGSKSTPVLRKLNPNKPDALHSWIPPKPEKIEVLESKSIRTVIGKLLCRGFKTTRQFADNTSYIDTLTIYTNDQCPFQAVFYKMERRTLDDRDLVFQTTAKLKKIGAGAQSRIKDKW